MEKSLVILKPDASERKLVGNIISRFEAADLKIVDTRMTLANDRQIDKHYQIDNDDYCISIGCKNFNTPILPYAEAVTKYGKERSDELKNNGKMILGWNRNYMKRSPLFVMIIEGDGAISRIREIVGSTNPEKASPGTIRAEYGIDNFERSNNEERGCENLVHASGSIEEAIREIEIWFPENA